MGWHYINDFPFYWVDGVMQIVNALAGDSHILFRREDWMYGSSPYQREFEALLRPADYGFTAESESFRRFLFDGEIEEDRYAWYIVKREDHLRKLLQMERNYNIIITDHPHHAHPYRYYLNYVENNGMVLAIDTLEPNLAERLWGVLPARYEVAYYDPMVDL